MAARGFTLIELLVSFSLIAVISGVAFVSYASYSRKQIVTQAAAEFRQTINIAKFNALSQVKPSTCLATDDLRSYTVEICINNNPNCSGVVNGRGYQIYGSCGAQNLLILTKTLPDNVSFSTTNLAYSACQRLSFKTVSGAFPNICDINIIGYSNTINVLHYGAGNVSLTNL